MRRIKQFFFLLCLLVAGAQSAWAQKTCTFNNCTYNLYGGYTFTYQGVTITEQPYAVLTGITGTAQDVVIPYSLEDDGTTYYVRRGSGTISNNNVKTLTFQSNFDFSSTCYLSCSQLTKIVFERRVDFVYSGQARLKCASLTDIVFKGEVPALSGSWSNYCTAPVGNVTAHVAAWTAEECIDKHLSNTTVWHDFADIVPYNEGVEETVKVYLTVEHGWARVDGNGICTQTTQTQTYTRNKRTNFLFEVCDNYLTYDLSEVYVNGKSVMSEMQQEGSWYNYTVEDMTGDVYIRIVGVQNTKEMWVGCNEGGTVVVTYEGESTTVQQYAMTQKFVDPDTEYEFLITPSEGYDLYKVFISVIDVTDASAFKPIPQGDGSYKITCKYNTIKYYYGGISPDYVITFKPIDKPVWTISQSDDCPRVELHSSVGSRLLEDKFVMMSDEIDATNTYKLMVYLEDEGRPVRVLCNGVDTTYQYEKYYEGALYYTMDPTKDEAWEVSYDTSHRQTFVVKGGTTEQVVEMEYEHLYGGPVLHANNNGIPASAYLPPFDNEYNSYVYLTFYVKEGETATIFRNGVDVTDKFERGGTYYDLQINDADYDNNNTLSALGFDIREPATWEITIDDLYSVHHEVTLVGSENNNVTFDYQDANGDHEDAFSSKHGIFKTPPYDYNSYNTFMLDVDVKTGEKLHVFCNGEEVTEGLVLISTATDGTKTYEFYADDPETNYIMAELDINVFEGCSWVILIDDGSGKFDVNGDGEINVSDVTALVSKILHP